jgi:NAD(P)-dependent dehydrogenase (short-subunit alcohol dehydrogenase family)
LSLGLEAKRAVVTGSTAEIGFATAKLFATEGAKTAQLAVARRTSRDDGGTGVTVNSALPGRTASEGVAAL